jgi:hypothetical protein
VMNLPIIPFFRHEGSAVGIAAAAHEKVGIIGGAAGSLFLRATRKMSSCTH